MTAATKYMIEKITKGRWVIASTRASGVSTGGGPFDDGEESTTVVAPMTASRIPNMSRYVVLLRPPFLGRTESTLPGGSVRLEAKVRRSNSQPKQTRKVIEGNDHLDRVS
jgi:hypothetical protein